MKRSAIVAASVLFGVIGLAAAGLWFVKYRRDHAPPPPVFDHMESAEIVLAKKVLFQPRSELTGTVFSRRTVRVQNEMSGIVKKVNFESGSIVEADQVLITLDDSTDRADLAALEASVRVSEADLNVVEARIRLAEAEYDRQLQANRVAATSAMEVDRAKAEVDKAAAERARVQAEIEEAKAKVQQMQVRLAKFTIRAPFRSRVGMRSVHEGQFLPPQMGMGGDGGSVAVLEEVSDTVYLDFAVPQEFLRSVQPGMIVEAASELFPGQPLSLKVVALDSSVDRGTRNIRVRSEVKNPGGTLRQGMSVKVSVPVDVPVEYVAVPAVAIRRASYGDAVYAVEKDKDGKDRAVQRFVKLGPVVSEPDATGGAAWIAVLTGVKEGDRIAATGSFKLRESAIVIDVSAAQAAAQPTGSGGHSTSPEAVAKTQQPGTR